jgi:hypothetical protein
MKPLTTLGMATALFMAGQAAQASQTACTMNFSQPNSVWHTEGQSRTTFAYLTTWNASGVPAAQRLYTPAEFNAFQSNSPYGSIYSPLWDYSQKCRSTTNNNFTVHFVPAPMSYFGLQGVAPAYDHFHLNFTDPAMIQGLNAGCFCDPGDGYGYGFAALLNGRCPTNAQCEQNFNWSYEPRNLSPHSTDEWIMMAMDTTVCDPTHCWSTDAQPQTFQTAWLATGKSSASLEAWFYDIYGNWYYEGPIPPNTYEYAPTSNSFYYVLLRSYKGNSGVYALNSIQVIPDN